MSKPTNAIRERKNTLKEEADQRREEFKDAKEKLSGNPQLIEAIEALEGELDAIRKAVNLDT